MYLNAPQTIVEGCYIINYVGPSNSLLTGKKYIYC